MIWSGFALGVLLFGGSAAQADLVVSEFAGTFGTIQVDASDLKQFTLADGLITFTLDDDVDGMSLDPLTFDLTGYAGPLGTANPITVVDNSVTIRLASTSALYNVVSAQLTQLANTPIAVGFVDLELTLEDSDLGVGGVDVLVPSSISSLITINGLRITVAEQGGQMNGNVQLGAAASASITAIPEPTVCALAAIGLMIVTLGVRRGRVA